MNPVELFIEQTEPSSIRQWMWQLHDLILDTLPQTRPGLKYHIPFYDYHRWLCFLNPKPNCVELGFPNGFLLSDSQGLLENKHLKQVRYLRIYAEADIHREVVVEILLEAALINENWKRKKQKPVKRSLF